MTPGRAYFLMNTLGSTTHRLNRVAKTAPAAMISIIPFAPQTGYCQQYAAQLLPTIYQLVNSLLHPGLSRMKPLTAQISPGFLAVAPPQAGLQCRPALLFQQHLGQHHPQAEQPHKNAPGNKNLHNLNPPPLLTD